MDHNALQSWYATMCNAQCKNSEDNLFSISCIQTPRHLVCLTHFKQIPFTDKFRLPSNAAILCLYPMIIHSDFRMFSDSLFAISHNDTC